MNIARVSLSVIAATFVVTLALTCLAETQPASGPVGSPEGAWQSQIHWIPMTDAADNHHLLQARICRPLGDMPSRFLVLAHGTFPNNRDAVPGRCEAETTRWFLDRSFVVVMALRRGYGATGGPWVEGIYHRPGDDYLRPASRLLATSRLPSIMPPRSPLYGRIPGLSSVSLGAAGVRSPTILSRIPT